MKPVTLLLPAEEELTQAARFYEDRAAGLGAAFLDAVGTALKEIASHPTACAIVRSGIRRKLLRRFPFGILYAQRPDEIVVIAVMHLHRRPDYWTDRL